MALKTRPGVRGQLSVELILVFSLFLLLILWGMNYANAFGASAQGQTTRATLQTVAIDAANMANSACAAGTDTQFRMPCAAGKDGALETRLEFTGGDVVASASGQKRYAKSVCGTEGTVQYSCATTSGEWLCFDATGRNAMVKVSAGKCADAVQAIR
ncbi:hypothetical protein HY995_05285 [Candidatus Micrarchaeota archaeon]|nr:hypothetical protein [Candidatus Micrarchaeota archaeon]MBI5177468.1 hypothetical protein [Candidatus Micrarchaeota archaeon]